MPFPDDYKKLAVPRLQAACRYQALQVVTEFKGFDQACAEVMALAYRLGAAQLSRQLENDVHDAVNTWMLEAVDAALPAWREAEALADKVARDIDRYETKMREVKS